MFERFKLEGAFAANRRQILDMSKQNSCKNCEKFAKDDPEADMYMYDNTSRICTKLRALHRHDSVFSVITDPIIGPNGQVEQKPYSLITHESEFPLSNEHHHVKFMDYQDSACKCRQRAAQTPGTRFALYDNKTKTCIGVSKSATLTNYTLGVRRGKLIPGKGNANNKKIISCAVPMNVQKMVMAQQMAATPQPMQQYQVSSPSLYPLPA